MSAIFLCLQFYIIIIYKFIHVRKALFIIFLPIQFENASINENPAYLDNKVRLKLLQKARRIIG